MVLIKILWIEEFIIDFNVDTQCSNVSKKIIPAERSQSCELCCENYSKTKKWTYNEDEHGWKPNSFWNNRWYQVVTTDKNGNKYYQMICSCNVQKP